MGISVNVFVLMGCGLSSTCKQHFKSLKTHLWKTIRGDTFTCRQTKPRFCFALSVVFAFLSFFDIRNPSEAFCCSLLMDIAQYEP